MRQFEKVPTIITRCILTSITVLVSTCIASAAEPAAPPFLFGAQFPNKPSDAVNSLFFETGMNCIRLDGGGYGWETEDQKKLADLFQSRGLSVYAQLASHYPSAEYFNDKSTWFVDQNGKTGIEDRKAWAISYDGNNWPQLSYASADKFFPQMEKDFTRYLNRLSDDHNILGIILHNEPGLFWMSKRIFDYNADSIAQFRQWLPQQHKDIAALNACWGSAFATFDVVDPPKKSPPYSNAAAWMDWRRFQRDIIANFMRREAEFSANVRPDVPRTTNLPGPIDNWFGYHLSDIVSFSQPMDVVGIDLYPAQWTDRLFFPFSLSMAHGAAQDRPVHVLECDVFSDKLWKGISEPDRAGMLRGELWTMIGHGARAIFLWGFHHDDEFSLTDGTFNDRLRTCRDTAYATKMLDIDRFTAPQAKIAMCVDPDDFIYCSGIEAKPLELASHLTDHLHKIYGAISDSHVPVDVIETQQIDATVLAHYSILVLANASMMDAHCADQLQKYAKSGGQIIAIGSLATTDRWGKPQDTIPGFGLDKLFGVIRSSTDAKAPHWSNQIFTPHEAEARGPGITCNHFGKGKFFLIADANDLATLTAQISSITMPIVQPTVKTNSTGKDFCDVSSLSDGSDNLLVIASTLGANGKLPPTIEDVKLSLDPAKHFHEAFAFPPTEILDGIVHSGPRELPADGNSFDIGQLQSSTPILLSNNFTPLLAITAPSTAKSGEDIKISITCFNPSSKALHGTIELKLPDGTAQAANNLAISVPPFSDASVSYTLPAPVSLPDKRLVINAILHSQTYTVTGIPIDVQMN